MKRIISILLLASTIILAACESGEPGEYSVPEKYEVSRDEVRTFDYSWHQTACRQYSFEYVPASANPRGIFFSDDILKCYSPSTGTVTAACGDTLCDHSPFSDCPFSDQFIWQKHPETDGQSLYYLDRPPTILDDGTVKRPTTNIVKSDLYGMNSKIIYSTSNMISTYYLTDGAVYWGEYASNNGILLYRYDLANGSCVSPKLNSDEGLLHTAFIPVSDGICYVYDGALYKAKADLSESYLVVDSFAYDELYTDGKNVYYIGPDKGIFEIDLADGSIMQVYSTPGDQKISNPTITDKGIAFMLQKDNAPSSTDDYDVWKESFSENAVFVYDFEKRVVEEYWLGDFFAKAYIVFDDYIFAQEAARNFDGSVVGGRWYISSLTDPEFVAFTK